MEKKEYKDPEIDVVEFEEIDVIVCSADEGPCGGYSCNNYGTICSGGHTI